ncbi:RNA-binding protein 33-like isoform X2 [Athalia rosae]|uniref:RNA-binding protein 33-like isoform X2 n=1 Tax=Athalia rosae TaxID=37344 RepID=UPI0020341A7B|nr:RNA-binding protein 33-like isoform X2 [Athalia rosae]
MGDRSQRELYRMSEQCDENLLDEDLGDEEYDLGNDEEEALLADDHELETQSSLREEETDDVLDLGVTDALDDLEGEEDNVNYSGVTNNRNHSDYYNERHENDIIYYQRHETRHDYEEIVGGEGENIGNPSNQPDLREKLQKNAQKDFYVGNGQGMEDDDCEEAKERRNRFQNERTIISPKMNNEIPDSLENVVTLEQLRPPFRGRGRGRGIRGMRGGRFITNFAPRFNVPRGPPSFENQRLPFRPTLLENRPQFPPGPRLNIPNQQIPFQQNNPQVPPPYTQFPLNGPLQGRPQFMENRPPFNPNQFQGLAGPPGPRLMGPRPEFDPRAPPQNFPPNQPQFIHNQSHHFQNQGPQVQGNQGPPPPMQGNQGLPIPMQGNQVPLGQVNRNLPMQGNPRPSMQGNQGPLLLRNPGPPMPGHLRPQIHNQIPVMQGHSNPLNIQNQVPFENMRPYQDPRFCQETRPVYDSRPVYNEQPPPVQYNNGPPGLPPQPTGNMPTPLPPGHKILINPHFRGAVQPTADARLAWDSSVQQQHQQQPLPPSPIGNEQFLQTPRQFQNQASYNQPAAPAPPLQEYSQPAVQQNKSDDPYAYFSDVWQENKTQKNTTSTSSNSFHSETTNYSKDTYYGEGDNYKTQNQWDSRDNYQGQREQQPNYRDRDVHSRSSTDRPRDNRIPSTNSSYRNESFDHSRPQRAPTSSRAPATSQRGIVRSQQKRSPEEYSDRGQREISPKRPKLSSRNLHEVRTIDTLSDQVNDKKSYENEEPEMREYRKKLEEQKRLREKFLREKENRRKIAAMEKQYEKEKAENSASGESNPETKPVSVVTGVMKDVKVRPAAIGRGRSRPVSAQPTEGLERPAGLRIVRTIQTTVQPSTISNENEEDVASSIPMVQATETVNKRQVSTQHGIRRVVIHKPPPNMQKVATTIQKTVSNLQRNPGVAVPQKIVPKLITTVPGGVQKTLVKKLPGNTQVNAQKNLNMANQKVVINTQNNQRVVLQKTSPQMRKLPEIRTNIVKIENLAASTTENQIRRMCQGIGTLESIHMNEGSATIVFKTQSAAFVFHKKYQRKMLDLSLITVHLIPQTAGN